MPGVEVADGATYSFSELFFSARQLGVQIESTIDAAEGVVGILVADGILLIACQLAVLSSAKPAFLLVDPSLPLDRQRYLLEDSNAILLLRAARFCATPAAMSTLDVSMPTLDAGNDTTTSARDLLAPSTRLMYICYTSGSTGRPKGVSVSCGALAAYADANALMHRVDHRSRVLLTSAVSFDPCIGEAWTALLADATLCLPTRTMVREALGTAVSSARATHVCSTPALWATIACAPSSLDSVKCVALGGERMSGTLIERWTAPGVHARLCNIYGVTECTVYQASYTLVGAGAAQGAILGHALRGCTLTLLDSQLRPIAPRATAECAEGCNEPSGEAGEVVARGLACVSGADGPAHEDHIGQIAIGGDQLARGYLGRPALTAERFIAATDGGRLYLTGDLGAWTIASSSTPAAAGGSDGAMPMLRLLGRVDSQVKLNGIRLELGEVEGVLASCEPLVRHAAALVVDHRLVAAVEPCEAVLAAEALTRAATAALLTLHCRRWLPRAVCPSDVLILAALPLTSTGKLDRVALRPMLEASMHMPNAEEGGSSHTPSASDAPLADSLEMAVAHVWCNVLGVPHVSRRSDFGRLGGDSIKALLVTRTLSFSTEHAHAMPPSRSDTREGTAEVADYGVLRGVFAPSVLLRLPLLYRYAAFLRVNGVRAPPADDHADATNGDGAAAAVSTSVSVAEGPTGVTPSGDQLSIIDPATEEAAAHEAAAVEATGLQDELERVISELDGDVALEQTALQLVLTVAAKSGALSLARVALRLGGDPAPRPARLLRGHTTVNEHGLPPLHVAAREGHPSVVTLLLDARAPPTLLSGANLPPLIVAALVDTDGAFAALELLLDAGAPLAMRDDRRQTALHTAARVGNVRALRRLLHAASEDDARRQAVDSARSGGPSNREPTIELRDRWHRTALHWGVVNQQHAVVTLLVEAGASVNGLKMSLKKHTKSTSLPRETPLHSAARLPPNAAAPLLRLLLEANADPDRVDQFGQTALHVAAAASGQAACATCAPDAPAGAAVAVKVMLDAGAAIARRDDAGRTPQRLAIEMHADSEVIALIAKAEGEAALT